MFMNAPVFEPNTMFIYDEQRSFVLPVIQKCGNSSLLMAAYHAGVDFSDQKHTAFGLADFDPTPYRHKLVPVRDPVSRFQAFRTMKPQDCCTFYTFELGDIDPDGLVNEDALVAFIKSELIKNPHSERTAAHVLPQARFWDDLGKYREQFEFFPLEKLDDVFDRIGLPRTHAMESVLPERPLSQATLEFIADTYAEDAAMWAKVLCR